MNDEGAARRYMGPEILAACRNTTAPEQASGSELPLAPKIIIDREMVLDTPFPQGNARQRHGGVP
jgi:hypothetical protein